MTLVNDGSQRWESCYEGTQPVTFERWYAAQSTSGHLTFFSSVYLRQLLSPVQPKDCFWIQGEVASLLYWIKSLWVRADSS